MSASVFIAVLAAALLHAAWNAGVKGGADKTLALGAVIIGHIPAAVIAIWLAPLPAPASLPYMAAGVALHFGYQLFLLKSYETGDLTQVYPIARGAAPLIVAAVSIAVLGVDLTAPQGLAIAVIGVGIISLAFVRQSDGARNHRAAGLALITGCFIASYSVNDGLGARAAGTALGFFGWIALANGVLMVGYLAVRAPQTLRAIPRSGTALLWIGGTASFAAYAIVTWAFTQAPIALVTALRETSIVFALLIGVVFLRERLSPLKVFSTAATLIGVALLRLATV